MEFISFLAVWLGVWWAFWPDSLAKEIAVFKLRIFRAEKAAILHIQQEDAKKKKKG